MGKISVVVGGQFGSEAKGAVTGWLAGQELPETKVAVVRVAGPNAGHTVYDDQGRKYALRQVPAGIVTNRKAVGVIAAGSEIDPEVLAYEIKLLDRDGHDASGRLMIDGSATVIEDKHKAEELGAALVAKIGSTGKGIGAARADRLMRRAKTWGEFIRDHEKDWPETDDTGYELRKMLRNCPDAHIIIEGTQGYGLGLHGEHYPQVTSSDCRAIDFLAMAGISPWQREVDDVTVWVVARVYPIRVAGNSGPLKEETTWGALGLPEEKTTVTQKVRRVGHWDAELVKDAVEANGGPGHVKIALTMADQMFPHIKRDRGNYAMATIPGELDDFINRIEADTGAEVLYIGTGPQTQLIRSSAESMPTRIVTGLGQDTGAIGIDDGPLELRPSFVDVPTPEVSHGEGGVLAEGAVDTDLGRWWYDTAHFDFIAVEPKAIEYSSYDMDMIGQVMADISGQGVVDDQMKAELGTFYYMLGKIARMAGAYKDGSLPSDDTIHDITVYSMMLRRIRAVGGWPNG